MSWERKARRLERYTVQEREAEVPGYRASPQTRRERSLSLTHTHTKLHRKEKSGELAEQRRLWRMAALEGSRNFFSSPVSAVFQRVNFYSSSQYTSHSKKTFLEKTIKNFCY